MQRTLERVTERIAAATSVRRTRAEAIQAEQRNGGSIEALKDRQAIAARDLEHAARRYLEVLEDR